MENQTFFNIESLVYGIEYPKSPIVQGLFAEKVAKQEKIRDMNCLARITFHDALINRALPGGVPLEETLLLGREGYDSHLHICARAGQSTLRIATGYFPKGKIVVHEEYRHAIILRKLSEREVREILTYVRDNPEVVAHPPPKNWEEDDY